MFQTNMEKLKSDKINQARVGENEGWEEEGKETKITKKSERIVIAINVYR